MPTMLFAVLCVLFPSPRVAWSRGCVVAIARVRLAAIYTYTCILSNKLGSVV